MRVDIPQIPTTPGALAAILNECLRIHNRQSNPAHMLVSRRVVVMRATEAALMVCFSLCSPCAAYRLIRRLAHSRDNVCLESGTALCHRRDKIGDESRIKACANILHSDMVLLYLVHLCSTYTHINRKYDVTFFCNAKIFIAKNGV